MKATLSYPSLNFKNVLVSYVFKDTEAFLNHGYLGSAYCIVSFRVIIYFTRLNDIIFYTVWDKIFVSIICQVTIPYP